MPIYDITREAQLDPILVQAAIVVLDFWAPWCPPCRAFAEVFEEVSSHHPDIAFCRVNTQEEEEISGPLEVERIPTLAVIRDRVLVASQPGYLTAEQMNDLLRQVRELNMDDLVVEAENPEETS